MEVQTIDAATLEHYDKTANINERGVFFTVQKSLPLMSRGGSIVVTSSAASTRAIPGTSVYSATKAAVRLFVRTWTMELKDRGIRVNTLSPGPIDTPIIDLQVSSKEEAAQLRKTFAGMIPLGRMGRPEQLTSAALFPASEESSFVVGIDLCVDGRIAQASGGRRGPGNV